jgi:hypothetical protein
MVFGEPTFSVANLRAGDRPLSISSTHGDFGLPLTSIAVGYVRKAYGLTSRFDRLSERGRPRLTEFQ